MQGAADLLRSQSGRLGPVPLCSPIGSMDVKQERKQKMPMPMANGMSLPIVPVDQTYANVIYVCLIHLLYELVGKGVPI